MKQKNIINFWVNAFKWPRTGKMGAITALMLMRSFPVYADPETLKVKVLTDSEIGYEILEHPLQDEAQIQTDDFQDWEKEKIIDVQIPNTV